jgi:hypothetical protein
MTRINGLCFESWMIAYGKVGDQFYSDKEDRHLTAMSSTHKRNIVTERIIAVTTAKKEPQSKMITKVILL